MIKNMFDYFKAFFIAFDHANACASMHSLVEIHNKQLGKPTENRTTDLFSIPKESDIQNLDIQYTTYLI